MYLKEGSSLQEGRYKIERILGQGGFGITYLGIQTGLNRKVAIKEFFMKEYCNRDGKISHVSVPSMGSKALVERFRQKFVKEAQTISEFSHPHIIRIYDVFEENGTAYYVMEYHSSGSLSDLVKHRGKLEERESIGYIRQIAEALRYIHERNINHLDVKPENVLLNNDGHIVLIDFGMSKRYDADGEQTSTTPVGISHGYAPLEQYKKGGVGTFSPVTDIYSLGATFYKLVTGITPPDASEVDEDGLSSFPGHISDEVKLTIWRSMSMKRKDRPQNVDGFLSLLNAPIKKEDEDTVIDDITSVFPNSESFGVHNKWFIFFVFCLITALCVLGFRGCRRNVGDKNNVFLFTDTLVFVDTVSSAPISVEEPILPIKEEPVVPATCLFYVDTSPDGAIVYVDGKKIDKSPINGKEISRGKHTIKLVLDGYESFVKQYVFDDKLVVINEVLSPINHVISSRTNIKVEDTLKIESVKIPTTGSINGHEWVDLGLSAKWATMNVRASNSWEYGGYFAWGEINEKVKYDKKRSVTYKKYIGNISGDSDYDIARAEWGGSWRLPTKEEMEELINLCQWNWISLNGYNGYNVVGPNKNTIFFPVSGCCDGTELYFHGEYGYYWTSTPYEDHSSYYLNLNSGSRCILLKERFYGLNVRPVSD